MKELTLIVSLALFLVALSLFGACTKEKVVEVPVEKVVEKEIIKEVPVEKVVEKEIIKEVPVVEKVLKVGLQFDLTGPYRTIDLRRSAGALDWFRYINEEKGGIHGVKVEPILVESGMKVPKGISNYETLKEEGAVAHIESYTGLALALKEKMLEDNMLCSLTGTTLAAMTQPTTIACTGPTWTDHMGAYVKWIRETWKGEGKPKFAILSSDSPHTRELVSDQVYAHIEESGMELYAEELIPGAVTDTTPNLLRLKEAGIDYTYGIIFSPQMVVLLKDMERLGLSGNMTLSCPSTALPVEYEEMAEGHPEWLENILITYVSYCPEDPEFPIADLLTNICKRCNPDKWQKLYNSHYFLGTQMAMRCTEAIRLALEKVPYEKLTRADVLDGFYSIRDWDMLGTCPPATYTREAPTIGWNEVILYTWKEGKFTTVPGSWEGPGWWK